MQSVRVDCGGGKRNSKKEISKEGKKYNKEREREIVYVLEIKR